MPNHSVIQRITLFAKIDTTCSDSDLKKTVGKLTSVNCEKHFSCWLLWVHDLRVSRSQLALRAPTHQFTLLLCVCIWISTVISHCKRQLMHLERGNSVTFFNLFATVWMILICSHFFIILEENLKGPEEKNLCDCGLKDGPLWISHNIHSAASSLWMSSRCGSLPT